MEYIRTLQSTAQTDQNAAWLFVVCSIHSYALKELGAARRQAVVRAFVAALTRGGQGGVPPPIELQAHDPLRYTRCGCLQCVYIVCSSSAADKPVLQRYVGLASRVCSTRAGTAEVYHSAPGVCSHFDAELIDASLTIYCMLMLRNNQTAPRLEQLKRLHYVPLSCEIVAMLW